MATRYSGRVVVRLTVDDHGIYKGTVSAPGVKRYSFRMKASPEAARKYASDSAAMYTLMAQSAIMFADHDDEDFARFIDYGRKAPNVGVTKSDAEQSRRKNPSESTAIDHAAYQAKVKGMSNAALLYTMRDAADAIRAHPTGHKAGYYADEINYCANEIAARLKVSKGKKNPQRVSMKQARSDGAAYASPDQFWPKGTLDSGAYGYVPPDYARLKNAGTPLFKAFWDAQEQRLEELRSHSGMGT